MMGFDLSSRPLWRHPDFLRLWIGQTISELGSLLFALPLLGILIGCGGVGALLGTLLVGRLTRRLGLGPLLTASTVVAGLLTGFSGESPRSSAVG